MRVSLIVPVFNEEQAINPYYRAVRDATTLHNIGVEIVFINDGSTDRTAEHARALALPEQRYVCRWQGSLMRRLKVRRLVGLCCHHFQRLKTIRPRHLPHP